MAAAEVVHTIQLTTTYANRLKFTPDGRHVLVADLRGREVIGAISVQSFRPEGYGVSQIRLLQTIAAQAAVAIRNAQLFASAVKVPALFFLTLAVTFPSLYVFNALVGSRLAVALAAHAA